MITFAFLLTMKIGLYFGSFNPIHIGHLVIANHIVYECNLDRVWFVVSPQNPLKDSKTLLNEHHRLHLVELAIKNQDKFQTCNVEFRLPKPNYTIDTLTYLSEKHPKHEFSVIMGGDSITNIKKWKNYEQILQHYKVIVYERPGFEQLPIEHPNIQILKAPLLDISATYIRERIKNKQSIQYLVPDEVIAYIDQNKYYK